MRSIRIRQAMLSSAACAALAAAPAWGQATPDIGQPQAGAEAPSELAEIVVTATKRADSIQKVPISMQALGSELLQQRNASDFAAYATLLPSVSFKTLGPGRNEVYFRGISTGIGSLLPTALLPTVGVYFDEIPVTTPGRMLDVHAYDIARVEALSGPQGTLYGASSLSGTLRIIPNKPNPGKFEAGYNIQGNKYGKGQAGGQFEGFVNVPLGDRAALRAVAFYSKEGGYIDNRPGTINYTLNDGDPTTNFVKTNAAIAKDDFNPVETYGGRLALGIDLDDNWTVTPSIMAQHQNAKGSFLYDPRVGDLAVKDYTLGYNKDEWYQAELSVKGKIGVFDLVYAGGYSHRKIDNLNDYTYYTTYYDTSPAYPNYTKFPLPGGGFLDPTEAFSSKLTQTKMTHELRLASPADWPVSFQFGGFYQRQTQDTNAEFFIPGIGATGVRRPGTSLPFAVRDDAVFLNALRMTWQDYALFGEATWHIAPSVSLTGGIRGFKVNNTQHGFFGIDFTAAGAGCTIPITSSCANINTVEKQSGETHKVNLSWQVSPSKMIYATYSTGFRPGGANRRPRIGAYKADTLDNFELGFKTTWNRNLRINAALYYEKWKDMQYTLVLPGFNAVTAVFNAGNARVYGIEGEIAWSYHGLTLTGSAAYNNAALSTTFCQPVSTPGGIISPATCAGAGVAAPAGTRLPAQPRFKSTVSARYDRALSDTVQGYVQGVVNHQSSTLSVLNVRENGLLGNTRPWTSFDVSVGATFGGNKTIELFLQNAFDTRGDLSKNTVCSITLCSNSSRTYPIKPQFFGIKFGQTF
ncbi:MAG: TonB-dependent receptor [Novosphingobium sp.]